MVRASAVVCVYIRERKCAISERQSLFFYESEERREERGEKREKREEKERRERDSDETRVP